jgi:magnesium transporter
MELRRRRYHKPGTPPGTYDVAQTRSAHPASLAILDYDASAARHGEGLQALDQEPALSNRWIRVTGAPSLDVLTSLEQRFNIDPLVLEDVVNSGQRPKFNDFDPALFLILSVPRIPQQGGFEQLSIYVAQGVLITFMENEGDLFKPIEDRLLRSDSALRRSSVYYLLYALLDLSIDLLFPLLDRTAQRLEDLESSIIQRPSDSSLMDTHRFRNQLLIMRKIAWATREVVSELLRHTDATENVAIRPYLQDAYDHIVGVIDLVETQRDISTNLVEVYLSVISNRMNEVIKLLTVISTLFIPATFIASIYGMNFSRSAGPLNMPELDWPLGYLSVLGLIGLSMLGMLLYFRKKRWL